MFVLMYQYMPLRYSAQNDSHKMVEYRKQFLYREISRVMPVERNELRALLWSFTYFFCLLAAYYILRPVRDEMFTLR
jgi:ATP/ADP translocase